MLVFCVASSLCNGLVSSEWLWNFLVTLTYPLITFNRTVKPVLSSHSKNTKNVVLKTDYCLMMYFRSITGCSKLPSVLKTFVLSSFEWPLKTGFTVIYLQNSPNNRYCRIHPLTRSLYFLNNIAEKKETLHKHLRSH